MIRASYRRIEHLTLAEVMRLYEIFQAHYDHAPLATFLSDLDRKTGVFLLRRKDDGQLVGFSTYAVCPLQVGGRTVRGIFSGDTVIEKAYWGNRALQGAFIKRLLCEVLKNPFMPQYWLLISKGYKTYLLLANNFPEYYPRRDREDEKLRAIVEAYCEELFPGKLDRESMLLDFGPQANCLKEGVADVTPQLSRDVPAIAFFERRNPTWQRGTELPCVGRADLWTFFQVMWPQFKKLVLTSTASTARRPSAARPGLARRTLGWLAGARG